MLDQKIDETTEIAKELFKHSVINDDEYAQDKLMQIMVNLSTLKEQKIEGKSSGSRVTEGSEIEKVHRKVPRWMNNPSQYNSIILRTYMFISNNNKNPVILDVLEEKTNLNKKQFLTNYTQMKIMAEKNHAKVFTEEDGVVSLWVPVEKFIVELYQTSEENFFDMVKEAFDSEG